MASTGLESRFQLIDAGFAAVPGSFAADVREGLGSRPKRLPPKYFYDSLGSKLFEAITLLPEYYLTRAEREIIVRHAAELAAAVPGPVRLIELGSGSSVKTQALIRALIHSQRKLEYLPIDISRSALEEAGGTLIDIFPGLTVTALAAEYGSGLKWIKEQPPGAGSNLVLFLGSTIGNLSSLQAQHLFRNVRRALKPGDGLLVGADQTKDPAVLIPAYDDALGVTAAFNRNLLVRMNRELGARFDIATFTHRAIWDEPESRVEMHLVSQTNQIVGIDALDLRVTFSAGETIHTENSAKFDPGRIEALARETGFSLARRWTDRDGRMSLSLLRADG